MSNFPKSVCNLNIGGDNKRETRVVVARNAVHHAGGDAFCIELPIINR